LIFIQPLSNLLFSKSGSKGYVVAGVYGDLQPQVKLPGKVFRGGNEGETSAHLITLFFVQGISQKIEIRGISQHVDVVI